MGTKLFLVIFIFILAPSHGFKVSTTDLGSGFSDSGLTSMLRVFIEQFRLGLVAAHVGRIPVKDLDWAINSFYLYGVFHLRDIKAIGFSDFDVKNLSSSLTKMKIDVDVELPTLELQGNYSMEFRVFGIPIWGNGPVSLVLSKFGFSGGATLKAAEPPFGTDVTVEIQNPVLYLAGIDMTLGGSLINFSYIKLILAIGSLFLLYTVIVIVLAFFAKKIRRDYLNNNAKGFKQLPGGSTESGF